VEPNGPDLLLHWQPFDIQTTCTSTPCHDDRADNEKVVIETPNTIDVANLLAEAGLPREFRVTGLPGGGNNRVYRLDCGGSQLLLKAYFHHPHDPRDRLAAEFAFARFAWDHGLRCIPQPLARDDRNHLGLYEFIAGRALEAAEISAGTVDQAIGFFVGLNRHKLDPAAQHLPNGSEACFTLAEHLVCVQRRIARLADVDGTSPLDRAAAVWIRGRLEPAWRRVQDRLFRQATACGLDIDTPIREIDRCLSPSDFGFHNAIRAGDGRLRFIDFEYAGWDDPAKTVCDFLCQPKLPLPDNYSQRFTQAVVSGLSEAATHQQRIALLLGVYRLKWCCIMLNEFLPVAGQRRNFAQDAGGQEERKRMQLEKAGQALERIDV
jgi:hypothetical protein